METGLAHYNQNLVYDPKKTTYVWSPYAMTHAWLMRDHLADRLRAFKDNPPDLRRHMVGWASGNCQDHRAQIFRALQRASNRGWREGRVDELGRDGAVHALGACEHNVRWSSSDEYPPRGTKPWELYKDYRWVLALENSAEPGYVTEKLVNAMASGAVPVYYGDSRAARKVFKRGTFVDVLEIWRLKGHVPGDPEVPGSPPTEADWDVIADYVVAIDRDPDLYAKFFAHSNALNEDTRVGGVRRRGQVRDRRGLPERAVSADRSTGGRANRAGLGGDEGGGVAAAGLVSEKAGRARRVGASAGERGGAKGAGARVKTGLAAKRQTYSFFSSRRTR